MIQLLTLCLTLFTCVMFNVTKYQQIPATSYLFSLTSFGDDGHYMDTWQMTFLQFYDVFTSLSLSQFNANNSISKGLWTNEHLPLSYATLSLCCISLNADIDRCCGECCLGISMKHFSPSVVNRISRSLWMTYYLPCSLKIIWLPTHRVGSHRRSLISLPWNRRYNSRPLVCAHLQLKNFRLHPYSSSL